MIFTHFTLSFIIRIDRFSLSLLLVNYMRYECCAGGTTRNDLPAAGDLGRRFESPSRSRAEPWQGRDPTVYISHKMTKIHPRGPFTLNYNFVNFID